MRAAAAVCALLATSATATAPLFAWSNAGSRQTAVRSFVGSFDRQDLITFIKTSSAGSNDEYLGLGEAAPVVNLFVFNELDADDIPKLSAAHTRQGDGGALATIHAAMTTSSAAFAVPRTVMYGSMPLTQDIAAGVSDECDIIRVTPYGGGDGALPRSRFLELLSQAPMRCTVFIMPMERNKLGEELEFVAAVEAAASKEGSAKHISIVTAETVEKAAAAGYGPQSGRMLQSTVSGSNIRMIPEIMEGLLIGLVLVFFVLLGVSCVMGIQSPDVLHSTSLPAGKEY